MGFFGPLTATIFRGTSWGIEQVPLCFWGISLQDVLSLIKFVSPCKGLELQEKGIEPLCRKKLFP
ncbi:hypothetical protein JCM15519_04770 [Fundidesulfovibrio butyratiphilus]